jgi:hypothetical protein
VPPRHPPSGAAPPAEWLLAIRLAPLHALRRRALQEDVSMSAAVTEPVLDCDNPTYQRGYSDGQAHVIATCAKFLKPGEQPHERMERDHLDTQALLGLLADEKRWNAAMTVEAAIAALVVALVESKGWLRSYADAVIRDAIDRRTTQ